VTSTLLIGLDFAAVLATVLAAYLWFIASGERIRRVSKTEEINSLDLNRIIVTMNRTQMLNARAALASAMAALIVAGRLLMDIVGIAGG
jgi:hypothetical protein